MHKVQLLTALCTAAIGLSVVAPTALADEHDKKTVVTITEPLEVPGAVLQPGKYVFKLVESSNDRHIVIIKNERQNHTYATIFAVPNYKVRRTGKTELSFWETPAGQPKALRAWFYPGDNFGQEFMYPKTRVTEINQVAKQEVPEAPADIQPPAEDPSPQWPRIRPRQNRQKLLRPLRQSLLLLRNRSGRASARACSGTRSRSQRTTPAPRKFRTRRATFRCSRCSVLD